jgi:hypothetical protein
VQGWFQENGIEYLRAYPDALLAADPLHDDELFSAAEDDWSFENLVSQLGWAFKLGAEGGLFVTLGMATRGRSSRGSDPDLV